MTRAIRTISSREHFWYHDFAFGTVTLTVQFVLINDSIPDFLELGELRQDSQLGGQTGSIDNDVLLLFTLSTMQAPWIPHPIHASLSDYGHLIELDGVDHAIDTVLSALLVGVSKRGATGSPITLLAEPSPTSRVKIASLVLTYANLVQASSLLIVPIEAVGERFADGGSSASFAAVLPDFWALFSPAAAEGPLMRQIVFLLDSLLLGHGHRVEVGLLLVYIISTGCLRCWNHVLCNYRFAYHYCLHTFTHSLLLLLSTRCLL